MPSPCAHFESQGRVAAATVVGVRPAPERRVDRRGEGGEGEDAPVNEFPVPPCHGADSGLAPSDSAGAAPGHDDAVHPLAADLATALEGLRRVGTRMWLHLGVELDLTPLHADALQAIADGARHVSTLADASGRHVSSTSRFVEGLVARGLVDRAVDPSDRRAVQLTVTPEGRAAMDRVRCAQASTLSHLLPHLGQRDARELVRLVRRMADAAEQVLDPSGAPPAADRDAGAGRR